MPFQNLLHNFHFKIKMLNYGTLNLIVESIPHRIKTIYRRPYANRTSGVGFRMQGRSQQGSLPILFSNFLSVFLPGILYILPGRVAVQGCRVRRPGGERIGSTLPHPPPPGCSPAKQQCM